jgi:hypothetical protein
MAGRQTLDRLDGKLSRVRVDAPAVPPADISFHAWLHAYAKVRAGNAYRPYAVSGREPLFVVILILDFILGNDCSYATESQRTAIIGGSSFGTLIPDAALEICGGAQFGKTILALLLKTYLGTVKFRSLMYCLPDDDLVEGIIDTKERPEVIEQIPYVARMLSIGKGLTKTGRAVNKKGSMLYTDGARNCVSMMRGLGKFPTSFSADVVAVDERDDVKEIYADYLPGRLTSSDLRLQISIGTQRYAGAGQNAQFEAGTKHVGHLQCPTCRREHNPEEDWPAICRMSVTGVQSPHDPQLDNAGTFQRGGSTVAKYQPGYDYYFACLACGTPLNRTEIVYSARAPEQLAARHWSVRISQLCCSGLPVSMFVADWCTKAVKEKRKLAAFACDRLAIPRSVGQKISPKVLDRAATVAPYELSLEPAGQHRFGGFDTGDLCWFVARSRDTDQLTRLNWIESLADSDARTRVVALFATLKLDTLFVDAGPLRDLARDLALDLNGLRELDIAQMPDWETSVIKFASGVVWNGERGEWQNLKCAPVEFSGKPGSGIQQQARLTPDTHHIYPVISCNRDEQIEATIDDLRTAEDGLAIVGPDGSLRTSPTFLLPQPGENADALDTYRKHLLAGSCKERDDNGREEHYIDGIPNHYLLATTYAKIAETFVGATLEEQDTTDPEVWNDTPRARAIDERRSREVLA